MIEIPGADVPDDHFHQWWVREYPTDGISEAIGRRTSVSDSHQAALARIERRDRLPEPTLPDADLTLISSLYEKISGDGHRASLRRIVIGNSHRRHSKCAYCGLAYAGTIDHFLPKVKFPEFSVAMKNLVPSCSVCNGKKSQYVGGPLRFRHAYVDDDYDEPYLFADIDVAREQAAFSLRKPTRMTDLEFEALGYQFKRLDLHSRFAREFTESFGPERVTIDLLGGPRSMNVSRWASENLRLWETKWGTNHWKSAVFRALL